MSSISTYEAPDFASLVLRGLARMETSGTGGGDLCLELGLSFWIRRCGANLDSARSAMMAMREALVKASGIDMTTEPIPFHGSDPRLDAVNIAAYLRGLITRAAANSKTHPISIVEQTLGLAAEQGRLVRPEVALA